MPDNRIVLCHQDSAALVTTMAERLVSHLAHLQTSSASIQLGLTGGTIAARLYDRLGSTGSESAVDWSRVDLWWGDERFVPADDTDRNAHQALAAFAGRLDFDPQRVHQVPASGDGFDLDQAADAYEAEFGETIMDICLLGVGPDGHLASLFPDHPSSTDPQTGAAIAVRSAPKPPPERISLTFAALNRSRQVWFCVSGPEKAAAVHQALLEPDSIPASRVTGTDRTIWFLDADSASELPDGLLSQP